ncbi:MAG: hypothetical protein V3W04_06680 [Gammaproteobacteria bacterium]
MMRYKHPQTFLLITLLTTLSTTALADRSASGRWAEKKEQQTNFADPGQYEIDYEIDEVEENPPEEKPINIRKGTKKAIRAEQKRQHLVN